MFNICICGGFVTSSCRYFCIRVHDIIKQHLSTPIQQRRESFATNSPPSALSAQPLLQLTPRNTKTSYISRPQSKAAQLFSTYCQNATTVFGNSLCFAPQSVRSNGITMWKQKVPNFNIQVYGYWNERGWQTYRHCDVTHAWLSSPVAQSLYWSWVRNNVGNWTTDTGLSLMGQCDVRLTVRSNKMAEISTRKFGSFYF